MAKNDTHRWEFNGSTWVYLAPGEDEPQSVQPQRNEQIPSGFGLEEAQESKSAPKAADKS